MFILQLGIVAQACNPSHLEGRDREYHSSRPGQTKKFKRPHFSQWLGTVVCSCHPSCSGEAQIVGSRRMEWGREEEGREGKCG
jgi:hypothetical protein